MKTIVPFTDITVKNHTNFIKKISTVLTTGEFILSKEVSSFEEEFAAYLGSKYCVGVASGTDAIMLSLRALKIGKGDEVIVPAFTFVASVTPILMLGARPVFVDIQADFPIIAVDMIEKAITKKTKAIIAVHLYGYLCTVDKLKAISKKYAIPFIEDVSQAHGAMYKNKKAGSFGNIAAFSLYPTKNLGAFGDAGIISTNDIKIYKKLLLLRNHGQVTKYVHEILGYNSRLDALQAGILRLKLLHLDDENKKRKLLVEKYIHKFSGLPIELFIVNNKDIKPAHHLFVIRSKHRDQLHTFLKERGISSAIHYPKALPDEKILAVKSHKNDFPNARAFASAVLSLPLFPGMSESQFELVVNSVIEFFDKKTKK